MTVSVDRSGHYLERAQANLVLNGLNGRGHDTVRADVRPFVAEQRKQGRSFDLMIVDPPTFSTSGKREDKVEFDVQRDHVALLNSLVPLLTAKGEIWFSTNHRRFELDEAELQLSAEDLTDRTTPPDFARHPLHRCFLLTRTS